MSLTLIQRMTTAEALLLVTPYSDSNRNGTSFIFLDIDDGYNLKGIFFDDTQPNDKKVVVLSIGIASDVSIYAQDGTLASNRILDGGGMNLTFDNILTAQFNADTFGVVASAGASVKSDGAGVATLEAMGTGDVVLATASGNILINGLRYPNLDGSANFVLKTNGAGVLSFIDINTIITPSGIYSGSGSLSAPGITKVTLGVPQQLVFEKIAGFGNIITATDGANIAFLNAGNSGVSDVGFTLQKVISGKLIELNDGAFGGGTQKLVFQEPTPGGGAIETILLPKNKSGTIALLSDIATTEAKFKDGIRTNAQFAGNPKKSTVTFTTPYADTNYSISTGANATSGFTVSIESKTVNGFVINLNANNIGALTNVSWMTQKIGNL